MRQTRRNFAPILTIFLAIVGMTCERVSAQGGRATFDQLELENAAGRYVITFDETGSDGGTGNEMALWYRVDSSGVPLLEFDNTDDGSLEIFRLFGDADRNSLVIESDGIGIGTATPSAPLHVRKSESAVVRSESVSTTTQPRLGLDMINNGGVFFNMQDNSITGAQWQIANFGDSFSLKKAGGGPGMVINPVGQVRFVTPTTAPSPNFIIETNGDIFARGTIRSNGPVLGGSDRNTKENIREVDTAEILAKVVNMPITTWNYIHDEENLPHMGPMAQDFYAAFGLGEGDKNIAYMDKDGVALAAIQGLHQSLEARDATVSELTELVEAQQKALDSQKEVLDSQQEELTEMRGLVDRLEAVVSATLNPQN